MARAEVVKARVLKNASPLDDSNVFTGDVKRVIKVIMSAHIVRSLD